MPTGSDRFRGQPGFISRNPALTCPHKASARYLAVRLTVRDAISFGGPAATMIEIVTTAFEAAVATLPEPVHSSHVAVIAESILRTANTGERDASVLERIALMELRLGQRR
jgi:hypothetical protein